MTLTKTRIAIILSQLEGFYSPKVRVEQYVTDSETASDWLWKAYQLGDIVGKTILDQGSGTGTLGIGAHLLGAKEVLFIESESSAIEIAKKNILKAEELADRSGQKKQRKIAKADAMLENDREEQEQQQKRERQRRKDDPDEQKVTFHEGLVEEHHYKADVVIQNPPFGTRNEGADIAFLKKAFTSAPIIYSMHKRVTRAHIEKVSADNGYTITHAWEYSLPIKNTYAHHKQRIHRIDVTVFRFERGT